MAQLLVEGQRVVPARALADGFHFQYPRMNDALENLLGSDARSRDAALTEIYYNGECPVCRVEMGHYAKICDNASMGLKFIDSTKHEDALVECGLAREHLERRVYLRDAQGRLLSGLPALIELWSRMPGYRWLAVLLSGPLLHRPAVAIYDQLVAPGLAFWARLRAGEATGDSGLQAMRKG
jgi:predicted DCC family thiol-disulfide oxidoreductase YuxK